MGAATLLESPSNINPRAEGLSETASLRVPTLWYYIGHVVV